MTENKPIIIDGVDVSICCERSETISGITCGNSTKIRLADRYIYKYKLCKDNPNCLFKQLARKTQECEGLKEENFTFEQLIKEYEKYGAIEEIIEQLDQLKVAKEQAEHKLKRIKDILQNERPFIDCSCGYDILQIVDEV